MVAYSTSKGITLSELLISVVLISMVALGVSSFAVAIRNLQSVTARSTRLALMLKSAVAELSQDAFLAIGTAKDMGIVTWTNGTDSSSICFRHDLPETPRDYADDSWVCYWHDGTGDLYRGINPRFDPSAGCTDETSCFGGGEKRLVITVSDTSGPFSKIARNRLGQFDGVNISLTSRFDNTKPYHPVNNPEKSVSTFVSPPEHSR